MTKVCHMTSAHGVEDVRIFHKECVSLAKAGYDVYLVERGESYDKNGVHITGVGDIPHGRIKRMTQGAKAVYQCALGLDAEIYHLHDPELLPFALKLKKRGKKVIFDSHEVYTEQIRVKYYLPHWIAVCASVIYGRYERHVLRNIDGLVVPALPKPFIRLLPLCKHCAVSNNVPRLSELYDKYAESAEKWEHSVCHIGSLTEARGLTQLIKGVAKAECRLYLGGVYSPPEYQTRIEALSEYKSVSYLGKLNREQVLETLQHCQVGVSVSRDVGQYYKCAANLPTKVYEFMAMGMPTVLNDSPYNQIINNKYHFGICVDPENVDEIAEAIRYLFDHPDEAKQMGENGRRAVKEEFNWEHEEKKLLQLYENILKDR